MASPASTPSATNTIHRVQRPTQRWYGPVARSAGTAGRLSGAMAFLLVTLLSLLVGAFVYMGTVKREQAPSATGFATPQEEVTAPQPVATEGGPNPGYTYLQVSTQGPALRDRLQGIVGVIVLLIAAAAALAFVLYELGHLVNNVIERFLD